jgi:hypothetical protein
MRISLFFYSILALPLFGASQSSDAIYSPGSKKMFADETNAVEQGVTKQERAEEAKQLGAAHAIGATSDIVIVDAKAISDDWVKAFQMLTAKKIPGISFILSDSTSITEISNIEVLPGGYLMLFTRKTPQGYKYQIVKTSTITSIVTR